jgi:membrane protein implicated in regulation of membrane protease activity
VIQLLVQTLVVVLLGLLVIWLVPTALLAAGLLLVATLCLIWFAVTEPFARLYLWRCRRRAEERDRRRLATTPRHFTFGG